MPFLRPLLVLPLLLTLLAAGCAGDRPAAAAPEEAEVGAVPESLYDRPLPVADSAETLTLRRGAAPESVGLEWRLDGEVTAEGIGLDGPEQLLAAAYLTSRGLGVGVYRVDAGGLAGWKTEGDGLRTETAGSPLVTAPDVTAWPQAESFSVAGVTPKGDAYSGVLQARPWGGAAAARWTVGGQELSGALLVSGKLIIAAFRSAEGYGVGLYHPTDDGGWTGHWAVPGVADLGGETLLPDGE